MHPSHQKGACWFVISQSFESVLGARASPIVRVSVAAVVVRIDVPKPRVAAVVVVTATARETPGRAESKKPIYGTFPIVTYDLLRN